MLMCEYVCEFLCVCVCVWVSVCDCGNTQRAILSYCHKDKTSKFLNEVVYYQRANKEAHYFYIVFENLCRLASLKRGCKGG